MKKLILVTGLLLLLHITLFSQEIKLGVVSDYTSFEQFDDFTKELQVANLVREGRTTKERADSLNISTGAIDFHRNSIRKKFGLSNKKLILRVYLLSFSSSI